MGVKRQRLGEPLATIPEEVAGGETSDMMTDDPDPLVHEGARRERFTKKTSREQEELSCGGSDPKRMRTACLRVSSVKSLLKPSTRTEDSIAESREIHIKLLLEDWSGEKWEPRGRDQDRIENFVRKIFDDAHDKKSGWCAREFAAYKDPSVFAAPSDVDNTSLIDLLAVKRGHGIMCFDAVSAFGQAPETQLIFIEAPEEHREKVGQHILWQCLKVRESRRQGARAWQDHFVDTLLSMPASFQTESEVPDDPLLE